MGAYETDGMYGAPVIETNCLESIEMAMTFDVRDWSEDRRSAWIWGIVFGYEEDLDEMKKKYRWSDEDINRLNKYHEEWKQMREQEKLLEQEPSCKECKWWKDSDGAYRRSVRAESKCPINRKEVYEGNGFCYMFEPQESEDKRWEK